MHLAPASYDFASTFVLVSGARPGSYSQDGKLAELTILSLGQGFCHDRCLATSRLEAAQTNTCLSGGVDRARICVSRLPPSATDGLDFQPARAFGSQEIFWWRWHSCFLRGH